MNERMERSIDPADPDASLVKAFQAGDKAAFDGLVLRYQDRVFRTCLGILGDHDEADDLAQEVFIKVYRSLDRFRFEAKFSTWLYRITVNMCRNKLSSAGFRFKRKTMSIDAPDDCEGEGRIDLPGRSMSPAAEVHRNETAGLIRDAIGSLSEDRKQIVVLRDIEGLSYEEVAQATGYSIGTVKSKLSRAREQLRQKLKGLI